MIYNIEMEEEGWKKEDGRGRRGDERKRGGKYEKSNINEQKWWSENYGKERERKREREREKEREREGGRRRDRDRERERDRYIDTYRETDREREGKRDR